MKAKAFEIRDHHTFIPMVAIKLDPANDQEAYLLRRAGFHTQPVEFVLFTKLEGDQCTYNPFNWGGNRTRVVAHQYIQQHFDELEPGAVIDVEFILGESKEPKKSERTVYSL